MSLDCHHADGAHPGLRGQALSRALNLAESRCEESQERLTPPRRRVLELLLGANAPLKAYDLIAAYGSAGAPAKPPTVYRALEFLERLGFAHRIESLNAYVPCRLDGAPHSAAFLICAEPPAGAEETGYRCGACDSVILADADPDKLRDVVVRCGCGEINQL